MSISGGQHCTPPAAQAGFDHQLQEVLPNSKAAVHLSGFSLGLVPDAVYSSGGQTAEYKVSCGFGTVSGTLYSSSPHESSRDLQRRAHGGPSGQVTLPTHPATSSSSLHRSSVFRSEDCTVQTSSSGAQVVEQGATGLLQCNVQEGFPTVHHELSNRCQRDRVELSPDRPLGVRSMDSRTSRSAYQSQGISSPGPSFRTKRSVSSTQDSLLGSRQHHSPGVHQERGRYKGLDTVSTYNCSSGVVPSTQHSSYSEVCSINPEHSSGQRIQISCSGGLVSSSKNYSQDIQYLGHSGDRPHGDGAVGSGSGLLCLRSSGQVLQGDRRFRTGLGLQNSLSVSTSTVDSEVSQQNQGVSTSHSFSGHSAVVAKQTLVPCCHRPCCGATSTTSAPSQFDSGPIYKPNDSGCQAAETDRLEAFWTSRAYRDVDHRVQYLVNQSWKEGTNRCYQSAWRSWVRFCQSKSLDPINAPLQMIASFLAGRFYDDNLSYSSVNVLRSAISATHSYIDNVPVGQHPFLCRMLKGVYNIRPPKVKLVKSWQVSTVISSLKTWDIAHKLTLRLLTFKTVFLLALVSLKRANELHRIVIDPDFFQLSSRRFRAQPTGLGKTDRPKHLTPPIDIKAFCEDPRVDPVYYLNCYVKRTDKLRGNHKQLFISFKKPYKPVSVQTISRWIVQTLRLCGIVDVNGHSTRSVGATTALEAGVNIEAILSAADWSSSSTFKRYYFKPDLNSMSSLVLKSNDE